MLLQLEHLQQAPHVTAAHHWRAANHHTATAVSPSLLSCSCAASSPAQLQWVPNMLSAAALAVTAAAAAAVPHIHAGQLRRRQREAMHRCKVLCSAHSAARRACRAAACQAEAGGGCRARRQPSHSVQPGRCARQCHLHLQRGTAAPDGSTQDDNSRAQPNFRTWCKLSCSHVLCRTGQASQRLLQHWSSSSTQQEQQSCQHVLHRAAHTLHSACPSSP